MSLVSLFKYAGKPLARAGGKILEKGSLPLAGLDLFELQRSTRGAVDAVQEGDKTRAVSEGLNAYGTTLFAPTTIDIAAKSNPKIMKAVGKVIPNKIKTPVKVGYNLIKKGIDKLPGSETVRKNPIRSGIGIFGGSAALEPTRDLLLGSAEAKEVGTPPNIENENIFTPIKTEPNESPVETKPDSVAETPVEPKNNIDQTIANLAEQDIPGIEEEPVEEEIKINPITEMPEVNANKNKDGENVLQGSDDNLGPSNNTPVPTFIVKASKALKSTINETIPKQDGLTTSLLLSNVSLNDAILKEKYKIFEERKEELKRKENAFPEFDEFYERFNKMAGKDVPDASKDFILLKFGLNLMQGTTDQQGMAGLLDIVGRAGNIAVEELQQIYMLEKEKREAMALQYLDFENTVKENLDRDKLSLLNSSIDAMQQYQTSYNSTLEALLDNKAAYYTAFAESEKLEREAIEKRYKVKNTTTATIPKKGAVIGFDNIPVSENDFGELMLHHTGRDGINKPYLYPDLVKEVSEQIKIIDQSAFSNDIKNQKKQDLMSLLNVDMTQVRDNKITEAFNPKTYRKNKSRLQTTIESINGIRKIRELGASAIDPKGKIKMNPFGIVGGFNEFVTRFASIGQDIFDKEEATAAAYLKMPVIPDNRALYESLSEINTFVPEDGEEITGAAAGLEIAKRYSTEINDVSKEIADASDKEVNNFLKDNEFVKNSTLELDQKRALFKAIKIAQVQLKYSLANSFKGEDRLTEKNLNEFGELTRFIGGLQSVADVTTALRELEQLAYGRLKFEFRTLINAGASEAYIRRQIGDQQFNVLSQALTGSKNKAIKELDADNIFKLIPKIKKGITGK